MYLTKIAASDFLSFDEIDLTPNRSLTVIVGPNGSGKTNLARILDLAVRAVQGATGNQATLSQRYARAGHFGARRFSASIGMVFDQPAERSLIEEWAKACILVLLVPSDTRQFEAVASRMPASIGAADVLGAGTLHVTYDESKRTKWRTEWVVPVGTSQGRLWLEANRLLIEPTRDDLPLLAGLLQGRRDALVTGDAPSASGFRFQDLEGAAPIELWVREHLGANEPDSVRMVYETLGWRLGANQGTAGFSHILNHLLATGLTVTSNRRARIETELLPNVPDESDLINLDVDGSRTASDLYRLKNGQPSDRKRFDAARCVFTRLTDRVLDVQTSSGFVDSPTGNPVASGETLVSLVVTTSGRDGSLVDLPIQLSGAGIEEGAVLSTLLTDTASVLVLDEPATNLSPIAQRRLIEEVRRDTTCQTILITHSAHLVPFTDLADLSSLSRLTRDARGHTVLHTPTPDSKLFENLRRLYRDTDLRATVFAAAVLLVEGPTDEEAMTTWLAQMDKFDLPRAEDLNVLVVAVGGDQDFGNYARMLTQLGVPFGIMADGPAFRNRALNSFTNRPDLTDVPDDYAAQAARWREYGVYTVAAEFPNDGSKAGEIEAFFERVNPDEWSKVKARGKPRRGLRFALAVEPPEQILAIWREFLDHAGLAFS